MFNDPMVPEHVEIWKSLLKDWTDCCADLEKQILRLEVHYRDDALIEDLLGRMRRIKRGSSFAGWTFMTGVAHEMEAAVRAVRDNGIDVDSELIDLLLSAAGVLGDGLRQLRDRLGAPGIWDEGGEWAIGSEGETKWHDVARRLRVYFESRHPHAPVPTAGEAEGAGDVPDPDRRPVETKEQFLFEMEEHLDRMVSEHFPKLDRDAQDRDALRALWSTVRGMGNCIGEFHAVLLEDSVHAAVLNDLLSVVQPFEHLLGLVGDKRQAFSKNYVNLGREVAGYVKAALESVALENGGPRPPADLLEHLRRAADDLASVRASVAESGEPFPAADVADKDAADKDAANRGAANTDRPAEAAQKAALPQSIRVSQDKLDKMMNMISELLIAKNAFMHLSAKLNAEYDLPELSREVKEVGVSVHRISDELQNAIMSIRMVEVKTVFQKMPRIVRDVAQLTGKKMELTMVGETTEIDKTIVEQISDPLVHLIRNAADHGIENREERLRKGKSETGKITLRAYNKDKHVYIEIEDDGKGIDPEVLKRKALERGFITPEQSEKMTKSQLINLIFLPGFSTAGKITEVSGRGVGMDIVKSNIEKINGSISIESEIDRGTKVVIRLPLTLAISRGLVVDVSQETYIVPIEYISKTVKIYRKDIHAHNGKYFAALDGEVIGIEWMSKLFFLGERNLDEQEAFNAVIIANGDEKFGMIVDKLRNEQEFVIKTFHGHLAGIPGISGSTLLGNGQVVLIVNPVDLMQLAKNG